MIANESADFIYWSHTLKDNYRKGVHRLRAILAVPLMAEKFALNLGAVSVVYGTPIGVDDKNSDELFELLVKSKVAHIAANTFLSANGYQAYPTLDDKFGDYDRCVTIATDAFLVRSIIDSISVAKLLAGLIKRSPSDYADMDALVIDSDALTAIAADPITMNVVNKSSIAIGQILCSAPGLDYYKYRNIDEIVADAAAVTAIRSSSVIMAIVNESNVAIGKILCSLAKLDSTKYADMDAITIDTTAVKAVLQTVDLMNIIVVSRAAMTSIANSKIAMTEVMYGTGNNRLLFCAINSSIDACVILENSPIACDVLSTNNSTVIVNGGVPKTNVSTQLLSGDSWVVHATRGSTAGSTVIVSSPITPGPISLPVVVNAIVPINRFVRSLSHHATANYPNGIQYKVTNL